MKKLFFILTLCFLSISADLSATPKKETLRFSPATESVVGGVLVGSTIGLITKTMDYLLSNPQIKPGILAFLSVTQGTLFGLNYYNEHPDRNKNRSKLLNAIAHPHTPITGLLMLMSTGYPPKGPGFFSLYNTATAAIAAGYLVTIGCTAALKYNEDKISAIKINNKDSFKTLLRKSLTHGAMLGACCATGLATAHGVNKLL